MTIQFDKMSVETLINEVNNIRDEFPEKVLLVGGGISENNISEYAKTKVNEIITTSL